MTTTDVNGVAVLDNGELVHLFGNGLTDGTAGNVKVRDISGVNTKELGEHAPGRRLRVLKLNVTDGSVLANVILYGSNGAILIDVDIDNELSGIFEPWNIVLRGLDIPLEKGVYVNVLTAD